MQKIQDEFEAVLLKIKERIETEDENILWAVTGSVGLKLQGVPGQPEDIDIQTDKNGAYRIATIFEDHIRNPVHFKKNDKIQSHFGSLEINGVTVEVMGALQKKDEGKWEDPVNIAKCRKLIELAGEHIPVVSLEHEAEAYRRLGREEKAKRIKKYVEET